MDPFADATIFGVTLVFMLIGLVGLIIPLFPGILVMWLATLVYGFVVGWNTLGIVLFSLITVIGLFASLADNLFLGAGAFKGGAAWWTILIAMAAGLIFTFLAPPFGGLIATPAVLLLLEYSRLKDWQTAIKTVKGAAVGWGISFFIRIFAGLVMIGLWVVWALFRV